MRKVIKFILSLFDTKTNLEFNENSVVPEITDFPDGSYGLSVDTEQLLGHPIISKAMREELKRINNG